jgi:hypothetical protein
MEEGAVVAASAHCCRRAGFSSLVQNKSDKAIKKIARLLALTSKKSWCDFSSKLLEVLFCYHEDESKQLNAWNQFF